MSEMSKFAKDIMEQKYSHTLKDGSKETWEQIAKRVSKIVLKNLNVSKDVISKVEKLIVERKFIPGGRYLYATGRPYHQVQNCALLKAEDSREGWADLMNKATLALMTGAGIGVDYSDVRGKGKAIRKTGGVSTGPIALMQMVNEAGRGIMQGGSRRSAIFASLSWKHPDVQEFIQIKNWSEDVRRMKDKDFNFPAPMDLTNVSVNLDDEFFEAFHNEKHKLHSQAHQVYWQTVKQMLKTAEPGFAINVGKNRNETLRNACVTGDTEILTIDGYERIDNLVDTKTTIWNGFEWSDVTPSITNRNQEVVTINFNDGSTLTCTKYHKFHISTSYRGDTEVVQASDLQVGMKLIKHNFPILEKGKDVPYAYLQGFKSAEGMDDYDFLTVYEPKNICLSRLTPFCRKISPAKDNKKTNIYFKKDINTFSKSFVPFNWNLKSKLDWFAGLLDGDGTELKEGGIQIASVDKSFLLNTKKLLNTLGVNSKVVPANKAGLRDMPDGKGGYKKYLCQETNRLCVGATQMQALKRLGLNCERLKFEKEPQRDASQFIMVTDIQESGIADTVYCFNEAKNHTGIFNGVITGNCTELTSEDDSDICNIGSINMARITSLEEMTEVVQLATLFLLAGTVYSDVPYAKVDQVRSKNRRLGLGLMGLHEWLLSHNKTYGPDSELAEYLKIYATSTEIAHKLAEEYELSPPIKTRAIAPTGTIGIIAETTTGIEPIFCAAFKRRYLKNSSWHYQYVLDPTAKKLVDKGVDPDRIEDAYTISENVERRIAFQAWVQKFVDHGISSTINLPAWGSELNNDNKVVDFGNLLIKYLPELRGVTCYPDGARGGQPLVPVKYSTAIKHVGEIFVESTDICDITKAGSCGA